MQHDGSALARSQHELRELLIVSVTPQNLERGVLWFTENHTSIKNARFSNPWWREHSFFIEPSLVIKPSEFIRRVLDLQYSRAQTVRGRGMYAIRGGIVELWPINMAVPYLIEFTGNAISSIYAREEIEEKVKPRISHATSLEKLPEGSFVVHQDHGIGIFRGIENDPEKDTKDFFIVEYAPPRTSAEPDRLFVPADQKNRLSPYVGFETPKIHRLGGSIWMSTKRKVREDTEKLAAELLTLYASRHEVKRSPHLGDHSFEESVRETFPFQETPDQLRAEEDILSDLSSSKPMDRVLAGDVGFGKTELAIRAALRVIISGKQVALLSPTTILAHQHQRTFGERLKNIPLKIAALSRITPKKEEQPILKEISEGQVDCVIGTHRLLSKDIHFKNLGLLIIDEEQRFGVKQKERFKQLREDIDVLSLSATPIPRTMQFILAKLRDISLLSTPPPERIPISTFVVPYSTKLIREAISRELTRGGQIYFLHNRIETIGRAKEKLLKMLENVHSENNTPKIGIIHGRMDEKELIRMMDAFRNKEINILLATTIIENGLDISSANTLLVEDATRLGLAQAHQLRGRIGRGSDAAFAYFLYRSRMLNEKAAERLEALQAYAELGSGYQIAMRDFEIRGAGNMLGREQSGAINKVGLNLYYQMLNEAMEQMKSHA